MTLNWKAPGRDQIANFWFKQLTVTHTYLATFFNKLIEEGQIRDWLTTGVTILIPENENIQRPKNYRPITCLPKIYKTNMSIISKQIQKCINNESLMPQGQKGCCRGSKECKDQLLISKAILQEYKCRKKKVYMAWIDYQKAFYSVPHSWIIKSFELTGINNKIISFSKKAMRYWKTSMCLHTEGKITDTESSMCLHTDTEDTGIQCEIFQGD